MTSHIHKSFLLILTATSLKIIYAYNYVGQGPHAHEKEAVSHRTEILCPFFEVHVQVDYLNVR